MKTDFVPLFKPGRILFTPAVLEQGAPLIGLLRRHVAGDWSEMSAEDQEANRRALVSGERIFSACSATDPQGRRVRIWIITQTIQQTLHLLIATGNAYHLGLRVLAKIAALPVQKQESAFAALLARWRIQPENFPSKKL